NNTVTECFHFGKPMIVLPLFWDQYDNAQRIDELGFGVRLPSYAFEPDDLTNAIDRLLVDADLRSRLRATAVRLQTLRGTVRAADLIERVAVEKQPLAARRPVTRASRPAADPRLDTRGSKRPSPRARTTRA